VSQKITFMLGDLEATAYAPDEHAVEFIGALAAQGKELTGPVAESDHRPTVMTRPRPAVRTPTNMLQ
jgi:hypothetical protein